MNFQTHGREKNSHAISTCTKGRFSLKVNGFSVNQIKPNIIRDKILEPFYILGVDKKIPLKIKIYVKGGGQVSRIYAIRQALSKSLLYYFKKFSDLIYQFQIKYKFLKFDKNLLYNSHKFKEPKKFGGKGARARFQKSYR
ncbi:40S ribosomal protein S16 (nucleomorph) [Lotharella oceanica]|uniref:40S ribosomal protein S16 n=1 Tax=Lotharella oceanica TaxID=641309 RepID=A0A060D7A1_9EUKA|nr:40S ribosomal protein S16 [Lotharella oceanica]|mmetsp:Transcript_24259/g.45368  ORF Transcript_24259/g.45368 Transcript_24259/m.45368 type:complete len:140 (-) Transcript_24259:4589-5008(-)